MKWVYSRIFGRSGERRFLDRKRKNRRGVRFWDEGKDIFLDYRGKMDF